jgi:hypothetical protein
MPVVVPMSHFVKRFLLYLAVCCLCWARFESPSQAITTLNVKWNASSDTNVQGYKVYYGTVSQKYTNVVVAGNVTNITVSGVNPGVTYYFAATSYNAAGWQSAYSTEIAYTVPANTTTIINPPLTSAANGDGGFNFSVNGTAGSPYVVLASTDLINWAAVSTNTAPFVFTDPVSSYYSKRFYKAILLSMYVPQITTAPPASPALSASKYGAGSFGFTVTGAAGLPYVVEASTNMVSWAPVLTNESPFNFVDSNASKYGQRFFKAIPLP